LLSPGIAPSSRYNAIQVLARAADRITIRVLPHSPFEEFALPISGKISSQIRLRGHNFQVQALDIMPSWQLSGPRVRSSLAFHLNEASQSKFLLSTLSATWPPPLERQDLPLSRPMPVTLQIG
jgi:hypothetical protein